MRARRRIGWCSSIGTLLLGGAALMGCSDGLPTGTTNGVRVVWSVRDPQGSSVRPHVDGAIAVFASNTREVSAFRTSDGRRLWRRFLPPVTGGTPFAIPFPIPSSSMVASGNTVVIAGWDLYGLDRDSGDLRWVFAPADQVSATALIVEGDGVIFTVGATAIFAVDAATGQQRWRRDLVAETPERPFAPLFHEGVVYLGGRQILSGTQGVGDDGHVWALDADTGDLLWRTPTLGVVGQVAVHENLVLAGTIGAERFALDRATGVVLWSREAIMNESFDRGTVVVDGIALFTSSTGAIWAVDPVTGEDVWNETPVLAGIDRQVVTGGGQVILTTLGPMWGVNASDGSLAWFFGGVRPLVIFNSAATWFEGRVYASANDFQEGGGGFYALEPPSQ